MVGIAGGDRRLSMRHKYAAVTVPLLLLVLPTASHAANARAYATCDGGQHLVSVSGGYDDTGSDTLYEAVVFKREAIGLCQPPEFLPAEPIPLVLEQFDGTYYTFEASARFDIPSPGVAYRYTPYGLLSDGSMEPMFYLCDTDGRNYAIANCDYAPIARGRLELASLCFLGECVEVISCSQNCWTEHIVANLISLPDAKPYPLPFGEVVDVYGDRTSCAMPGGEYYSLTRIELAPRGECGPVPVQATNWGRMKATFR
jgi:hypothetical protein